MKRIIIAGAVLALFVAAVCAQEDDFGDFGADFGGEGTAAGEAMSDDFGSDFGADGFGADFGGGALSFGGGALKIEGDLMLDFRAYVDDDEHTGLELGDWETSAKPKALLDFTYNGETTRANVKFKLDEATIADYRADIIDEMTLSAKLGNFDLEAGKMRVVWGKGDKLHVLDNFNANDYTDFLIPEYIDRRIAEPMARIVWNIPGNTNAFSSNRLEVIATPFMTADRLAMTGRWQPVEYNNLINNVVLPVASEYALPAAVGNIIDDWKDAGGKLAPNTNKLKYAQAGVRFTTTSGSWDWGISYYAGRNKMPSTNLKAFATKTAVKQMMGKMGLPAPKYESGDLPSLDYDMIQVFGLEGAKTFGGFNFRAEACYTLTGDTAGDDPWVHNNSALWVFGFDKDIPLGNLNVNVQTIGKLILKHDEMDGAFKTVDVDYNNADAQTNDKLVLNITDSWLNEKVKAEVTAIYCFERFDLFVMPKVTVRAGGALDLIASGLYAHAFAKSMSEYYDWRSNSFVQLGAKYSF